MPRVKLKICTALFWIVSNCSVCARVIELCQTGEAYARTVLPALAEQNTSRIYDTGELIANRF